MFCVFRNHLCFKYFILRLILTLTLNVNNQNKKKFLCYEEINFFQTFKIMCMIEPMFLSQAFWKYTKNELISQLSYAFIFIIIEENINSVRDKAFSKPNLKLIY